MSSDSQPSAPVPPGRELRRARRWALLWTAVVAVLLWTPGGGGAPSSPLLAWLERIADAGGDKGVHGALFAVHAWLLCRCRERGAAGAAGAAWLVACFVLTVAYGGLTELGQVAIAGRDGGWGDALANALGAALGVAVFVFRGRGRRER